MKNTLTCTDADQSGMPPDPATNFRGADIRNTSQEAGR